MMVVPVLTTICQGSLNWKMGPDTAQTIIRERAVMKVIGLPDMSATFEAKRRKKPDEVLIVASILARVVKASRALNLADRTAVPVTNVDWRERFPDGTEDRGP